MCLELSTAMVAASLYMYRRCSTHMNNTFTERAENERLRECTFLYVFDFLVQLRTKHVCAVHTHTHWHSDTHLHMWAKCAHICKRAYYIYSNVCSTYICVKEWDRYIEMDECFYTNIPRKTSRISRRRWIAMEAGQAAQHDDITLDYIQLSFSLFLSFPLFVFPFTD